MDKKIFEVYLAKEDVPNNEAYAKLNLPVSLCMEAELPIEKVGAELRGMMSWLKK